MKPYVIIGGGVAAVGCIEGIRTKDGERKIILISKENHSVYCRPLISYCIEGKSSLKNMKYREDDFYDRQNCEVVYGKSCIKKNPKKKLSFLTTA